MTPRAALPGGHLRSVPHPTNAIHASVRRLWDFRIPRRRRWLSLPTRRPLPNVERRQIMFPRKPQPYGSRKQPCRPCAEASLWLPAVVLAAGLAFGTVAHEAYAVPLKPFKVANIHFETNASACDMGIQIFFDTDGITEGSVTDPNGRLVYRFASQGGMEATGGQTEGFLEGVEP